MTTPEPSLAPPGAPSLTLSGQNSSFEGLTRTALSQDEILTYLSLRDGIADMTVESYGAPRYPDAELIATIPMTRRILGLAHRLQRRLRIVFFGIGCGYTPLWLAAEGLHVEVIESDPGRLKWASELAVHFFGAHEENNERRTATHGALIVHRHNPAWDDGQAAPADIAWLSRPFLGNLAENELFPVFRDARRRIVSSDIGLICFAKDPAHPANIWNAAQAAHLRSAVAEYFLLLQPFEIKSSTIPEELTGEPPAPTGSPTDFSAISLAEAYGLTIGNGEQPKPGMLSLDEVILGRAP